MPLRRLIDNVTVQAAFAKGVYFPSLRLSKRTDAEIKNLDKIRASGNEVRRNAVFRKLS